MSLFDMKFLPKLKKFWKILGPGVVTGAADDDPSGIATYSQAGAQYNLQFIWLSLFSLPLMIVVQEMCARIGMVTNCGLSKNIKQNYPPAILYFFVFSLFIANTFNIGANLNAMTAGIQLYFPGISFIAIAIIFAVLIATIEIFLSYKIYAKYLKYLAFVVFAYIFSAFFLHINWDIVVKKTITPTIIFNKDAIIFVCAMLGTTISPYLFFWQSSQEAEEKKEQKKSDTSYKQIKFMRWDVFAGMMISNVIMFFIILVCANTLYINGINDVKSITDAASALKPFAGQWGQILFVIGIVGTGMLSIPVLATSSAFAIAETFSWRKGLSKKPHEAAKFYGIIILSILIALCFNFFKVEPITALIYSAILNGITAPGILFLVVRLSNNKKVMGEHTNSIGVNVAGWFIVILMSLVALVSLISIFTKIFKF